MSKPREFWISKSGVSNEPFPGLIHVREVIEEEEHEAHIKELTETIEDQESIIDAMVEQNIKNNRHDIFQQGVHDRHITSLESQIKELKGSLAFVYKHLESMNGYSLVCGAREHIRQCFSKILNDSLNNLINTEGRED